MSPAGAQIASSRKTCYSAITPAEYFLIAQVRLLLYSNVIDIKAVIAITSTSLPTEVHPETLHDIVQGYRAVHSSLMMHDPGYPTADHVDSIIKAGNATYGMKDIGQ